MMPALWYQIVNQRCVCLYSSRSRRSECNREHCVLKPFSIWAWLTVQTHEQSGLLQYMQLFQTLYQRGAQQSRSKKAVRGQVCRLAFNPLEGLWLHVEEQLGTDTLLP